VPRVIGQTLAKAKAKIKKAHCKVGTVKRARSKKVGRVIGQSPRPGVTKPNGFKVKLVVGRR
jgi:beta-lactam-binding protein with PASTA domain